VQNVFPDQKPINRTTLNAWEDKRVVDAVKKTGRRQLIFAALWTEICLAYPVIHSLGDGYDVFFVTDASGGTTREAHDMAVQRLIQAGATPLTWMGVMTECAGTAVSFGNYSGKLVPGPYVQSKYELCIARPETYSRIHGLVEQVLSYLTLFNRA